MPYDDCHTSNTKYRSYKPAGSEAMVEISSNTLDSATELNLNRNSKYCSRSGAEILIIRRPWKKKLKNSDYKVNMEEEVCFYQKFGFCKYKEMCSKGHLDQECKDINACKIKKVCDKRHPKICKRYVLERSCVFGEKCEYLHKEN